MRMLLWKLTILNICKRTRWICAFLIIRDLWTSCTTMPESTKWRSVTWLYYRHRTLEFPIPPNSLGFFLALWLKWFTDLALRLTLSHLAWRITSAVKIFPKEFVEETLKNIDGYPLYRRRNNNFTYKTEWNFDVGNRWVVPYNKYLLLKYDCHINVEVCSSINSVKCLFTYVYNGHDCANIAMSTGTGPDGRGEVVWEEIASHLDTRCVSPPEGMWRLSSFPMSAKSHGVFRLQVLLYFHTGSEAEAIRKAFEKESKLNACFNLNRENSSAREWFYCEILLNFTFHKYKKKLGIDKAGFWDKLKNKFNIVTRIYSNSPRNKEFFFAFIIIKRYHFRGLWDCRRDPGRILWRNCDRSQIIGRWPWLDSWPSGSGGVSDAPSTQAIVFPYLSPCPLTVSWRTPSKCLRACRLAYSTWRWPSSQRTSNQSYGLQFHWATRQLFNRTG